MEKPVPASTALAPYTVLDLTRARSGPTAARVLADWGADVIKVERPDGDSLGFDRGGSDFQNLNRNKSSLALDLKQPEGRDLFRDLAARADVVIENYRPEVKVRLGIDYETLRAVNPRLIYASISGFGEDGPYRDRPGLDQIAQGMSGLMSITGLPGQGPVRTGAAVADIGAGLYAAIGILVALLAREKTGEGQWVQTSLLESMLAIVDFQAVRWLVEGHVPKQAGNDHPTSIPTGAFATADGTINIAASGDAIWRRFCEAIDGDRLLENPDYADGGAHSRNRAALNADIAALLA
ncbi:MAG: CaiB/BaiF CoA transferase family protein, partial [Alphaproteobacteria bacterium]